MIKQEPKIIAGHFSNEELLGWMDRKVKSAKVLSAALAERESLKQALVDVVQRVLELTSAAAIEVLQQEGLASNQFQGVDEFDSSPDFLVVSSVMLKVVKAELERQNVQPSVENIRYVLSIIDASLPAFSI